MNLATSTNQAEPLVYLYILSRDRKDFCREAVASAVAQDYKYCEVIVSDNSKGEDVAEMITKEFPNVRLVQRRPNLPALDHFNKLIEECQAPLMVLFHDDDVLESGYASRMVQHLKQHPHAAAMGCNANLIQGTRRTVEHLMGDFNGVLKLERPTDLVEPYMSLSLIDPAPFPGYMYRTHLIKGLRLNAEHGGKHSDVSFLCQVLAKAPIIWTDECLFGYRIHNGNDSRDESIPDRLSWLRYVQKNTGINRCSTPILDYKFIYWRRWLQQNSIGHQRQGRNPKTSSRRQSVGRLFVLSYGVRLALTRLDFWRRTWRLLRRKWLYR